MKKIFLPPMFRTAPPENAKLLTRQIEFNSLRSSLYLIYKLLLKHLDFCIWDDPCQNIKSPLRPNRFLWKNVYICSETLWCRFNNFTNTIYVMTAAFIRLRGVRFDNSTYYCWDSISICCQLLIPCYFKTPAKDPG